MIIQEYSDLFRRLLKCSEKYITSCKLTGSFHRIVYDIPDPRFITDYRNFAFAKSTKSLDAALLLLEAGSYEDVLVLTRTIYECYLSARYFDDKFDIDLVRNMILIPAAINEGYLIHKNGIVTDRNTNSKVDYRIIYPSDMPVGKDNPYFYDFYYFLCQNTHCNISQARAFLDEQQHFTLKSEHNREISHLCCLFAFTKIFESTVLLESVRFDDPDDEKECEQVLIDATGFLFNKLTAILDAPIPEKHIWSKSQKQSLRSIRGSLKEQLGRVDKGFVSVIEKQRIETKLEKTLKPALLLSDKPSVFFNDLRERGKLSPRYSELEALIGVPQNPQYHPEGDVWNHTMDVLDRAAKVRDRSGNPYAFMLLALCHDLGKPSTTEIIKGKIHSLDHEIKGVIFAQKLLDKITNNDGIKEYVLKMIPQHMKPVWYSHDRSSEKATNRMFNEAFSPEDLLLFARCDNALMTDDDWNFLQERYNSWRQSVITNRPS